MNLQIYRFYHNLRISLDDYLQTSAEKQAVKQKADTAKRHTRYT